MARQTGQSTRNRVLKEARGREIEAIGAEDSKRLHGSMNKSGASAPKRANKQDKQEPARRGQRTERKVSEPEAVASRSGRTATRARIGESGASSSTKKTLRERKVKTEMKGEEPTEKSRRGSTKPQAQRKNKTMDVERKRMGNTRGH